MQPTLWTSAKRQLRDLTRYFRFHDHFHETETPLVKTTFPDAKSSLSDGRVSSQAHKRRYRLSACPHLRLCACHDLRFAVHRVRPISKLGLSLILLAQDMRSEERR